MKRRDFFIGAGLFGLAGKVFSGQSFTDTKLHDGLVLKYRVFYGGNEIGHQEVSFSRHTDGDHVVIEHAISLQVKVFFAVAYELEHSSREVWNKNKILTSIDSTTTENGETSIVKGQIKDNGFEFEGMDGVSKAPMDLVTSDSFWIAAAMDASTIINTRTGDVAKPQIKQLDDQRFHLKADFAHGGVEATLHFDNGFLKDAEIDNDGHTIRFERITA